MLDFDEAAEVDPDPSPDPIPYSETEIEDCEEGGVVFVVLPG